jgi:Spy/CpxP family protein refolding chaperone
MNRLAVGSLLASWLLLCAGVIAQEPATQPSDRTPEARSPRRGGTSGRWGFAPYNRLSNVTEEQKQKIAEIRDKFLDDRRALEDKLEADVMAVLTEEQKAELDKMNAERKARDAQRRRAAREEGKAAGGVQDKDKEPEKDKEKDDD